MHELQISNSNFKGEFLFALYFNEELIKVTFFLIIWNQPSSCEKYFAGPPKETYLESFGENEIETGILEPCSWECIFLAVRGTAFITSFWSKSVHAGLVF